MAIGIFVAMTDWRAIPGFEQYEISTQGCVRRGGSMLKQFVQNSGYLMLRLSKQGKPFSKLVHRLVAETFIGPSPFDGACVCHADGNKRHNEVGNLRWDSRSGNEADKIAHGRMCNGSRHGNAKYFDADIDRMREMHLYGAQTRAIARVFDAHESYVSKVCHRHKRSNPTYEAAR